MRREQIIDLIMKKVSELDVDTLIQMAQDEKKSQLEKLSSEELRFELSKWNDSPITFH